VTLCLTQTRLPGFNALSLLSLLALTRSQPLGCPMKNGSNHRSLQSPLALQTVRLSSPHS